MTAKKRPLLRAVPGWALTIGLAMTVIASLKTPRKQALCFIVTGNLLGEIEPCGCAPNQPGGLSRRVTLLRKQIASRPAFLVEAGNLIETYNQQQEFKLETIAQTLALAGYSVCAIGHRDLAMPAHLFRETLEQAGLQPICCNVVNKLGIPLFRSYAIVKTRQSLRALVTAWIDPALHGEFLRKQQMRALPARTLLSTIASGLCASKPIDALVVIVDANKKTAIKLAKSAAFRPALWVYQGEADRPELTELAPDCVLLSPGKYGEYVTMVQFNETGKATTSVHVVDNHIPPDADAQSLFQNYQDILKQEQLVKRYPRTRLSGSRYAGSKSCFECHADQARQWKQTPHAHALETLKKIGRQYDPECVRCHVVGFGAASGYVSEKKTPSRAAVGCENCHGPGADHIRDTQQPYGNDPSKSCGRCHTPRHSPRFNIIEYLPKVEH